MTERSQILIRKRNRSGARVCLGDWDFSLSLQELDLPAIHPDLLHSNKILVNSEKDFFTNENNGFLFLSSFPSIFKFLTKSIIFTGNLCKKDNFFNKSLILSSKIDQKLFLKSNCNALNIIKNADYFYENFNNMRLNNFDGNYWVGDSNLTIPALRNLPVIDPMTCDHNLIYQKSLMGDLFCLVSDDQRSSILDFVTPFWNQLDSNDKFALRSVIHGFRDNYNHSALAKISPIVQKTSVVDAKNKINEYIQREIDNLRICDHGEASPFTNFVSTRVLELEEAKNIDGKSYTKLRYVYDNGDSNEFCSDILWTDEFTPGNFTTATIEKIFTNEEYFTALMKSSCFSVVDRSDYYRSWYVSPLSWPFAQIAADDGSSTKFLTDLRGRMGAVMSSLHAQLLTNLIDRLAKCLFPQCVIVSVQDDSLIFQPSNAINEKYLEINRLFSLGINERKLKIAESKVEFLGYVLDAELKTIRLKEKRIKKFERLLDDLMAKEFTTKRHYAKILGCIYSANIIFLANNIKLNPHLFFTRKISQIFVNFVKNKDLVSKEYDSKVRKNQLSVCELLAVRDFMRLSANFVSVKKSLAVYKTFGKEIKQFWEYDLKIWTDASDLLMGVCFLFENQYYSFAINYVGDESNQSIMFRESLAFLYGKWYAVLFLRNSGKLMSKKKLRCAMFQDNNAFLALALGHKCSLKSIEISLIMKISSFIDAVVHPLLIFNYFRITSEQNIIADHLSRSPALSSKIKDSLHPLLLATGPFRLSESLKLIKKLTGNPIWLLSASNARTKNSQEE